MQIHFGPDHDGLHVDPARPGAYEWWYFDALSDDDRYALVVIFFLGSPMSPYYKAVVNGKEPDPRDWCGVFVSLHEKQADRWAGRAYAYNLYRGGTFAEDGGEVAVGGSRVVREETGESALTWRLTLDEPGLWFGRTRAEVTFTVQGAQPDRPPLGEEDGHTWVCVAPVCRAEGVVNGIRFSGPGYHDHNFGQLPWADTDIWYWARASMVEEGEAGGDTRSVVLYFTFPRAPLNDCKPEVFAFVFDGSGNLLSLPETTRTEPARHRYDGNAFGLRFEPYLKWSVRAADRRSGYYGMLFLREYSEDGQGGHIGSRNPGLFADGPFYRRVRAAIRVGHRTNTLHDRWLWGGVGYGIGEVFRPARLCGPIASRAMWTRIRRRGAPGK